ncbi:MAG: glucosyltransferase domain-containing protein [Xenococcaceae cyanobacterium MO_188.B19]|nr:glucosyltransferase domain-containing protein [Xenococcaceae cyanobacterium MO_188.B19]
MFTKNRKIFKLISLDKKYQKAFLFIFFISLVCLSSLLQANQLYMDDLYRVMEGNTHWEYNGRPIASLLTILLQLGIPLTDISPLPQIICFVLYSLSVVYLAKIFKVNDLVLLILSGIIFVINPYNLSIYSFTFDSFPIGFGILSSILAFYLITILIEITDNITKKIFTFLFGLLLLIISLCLYQQTCSFYLVSFIFYLLVKLCQEANSRKSFDNFLIYLTVLLLSFIAYIPIKNHYVAGEYSLTHSQLPSVTQITATIIQNIIKSWQEVRLSLGDNSIILFLIIGLLILIAVNIVVQILRNNLNKKNADLITCLLLGVFYYIILLCSFIFPSMILASPPFSARIFTGFTALVGIGCLFLACCSSFSKFSWFKYVLIFYLSLIVLSFANISLTYGNVIYHQNFHEQRIGTLIIADIEEAISTLSISSSQADRPKISFANSEKIRNLRRSILNKKAFEKYPILYSIASPYFDTDTFQIFKSFSLNFEAQKSQNFIDKNKGYYIPKNEPIINRQLYNIYLENGDTLVIVFKE